MVNFEGFKYNCPWCWGGGPFVRWCTVQISKYVSFNQKKPCEEKNCAPFYWANLVVALDESKNTKTSGDDV